MQEVEASIVVDVPVNWAYNEWNHIERFPCFMKSLKEVRAVGDDRYLWRGERNGVEFESVTEVTLQIPERRLAWRSISGMESSGVVCFEKQAEEQTLIHMKMKYTEDAGWQEPATLKKRLEQNLQNFKCLVETGAC